MPLSDFSDLRADCEERIVAASAAQIDQDLAARLSALNSPDSTGGECFEPLGGMILEAVLWLAGAGILWIAAAVWAHGF